MSVLKIRDKNGKFISIFTIKGDKGDKGDPGEIDQTLLDSKQDKFADVIHEQSDGINQKYVRLDSEHFILESMDGTGIFWIFQDGSIILSKELVMAGNRISSLGTPAEDNDAANKAYVDSSIGNIETALDSIIAIQEQLIGGAV